ncbi:lens fiber membrane intrinsic protein [Melopsittacus undulatus]|uniref:lens fiber membrane intrinsic protein n=1 Tax=Melopsittacus undulatus TaxID=13146 RepID=UPI00146EC282|nr:lens fiber membrane intrinsic protein [Melopsittacus undulatus]
MPAGGGLLCGASGLGLLLAATATSSWLQRRVPGGTASIGLWSVCGGGHCGPHPGTPALWEATRVLMLLSVLMATAGLAMGLCAMAGTAWRVRVRAAGATLLLAGMWGQAWGGHGALGTVPKAATGLLALLGLGLYTAGTPRMLGPARAAWRFSWSYILGWVAAALISSAGLFHLCAAHKDPSPESSEEESA